MIWKAWHASTSSGEAVSRLNVQVDYFDNLSCRNNIRIDGLPEILGENWFHAELICQLIFHELGLTDIQVEKAHRTSLKHWDQPKTLVLKLLSSKDRGRILMSAKMNQTVGLFFNEKLLGQSVNCM